MNELTEEPTGKNAVIMSAEDHGLVLHRSWSEPDPWVSWGIVDPISWSKASRLFGPFVLLYGGDEASVADQIRNKIDEDAAERLFFEAIHQDHDCSRGWYDPSTGIVDGQAGEIVAALLKFGWKPPKGATIPQSGEIFEPMNDTRTDEQVRADFDQLK